MSAETVKNAAPAEYDVIVIGAGLSGMYQLYRLREAGFSVRVVEAGSDVGGTWYWNRYPGARFDSESWSYGYSFSQALLDEWEWSEHFAAQPETLRYCKFVADKFDLRRDMEFNCRVSGARFDDAANQWEVVTENGMRLRGRFLVTAVGPLSVPTMPNIPGVDSFRGEAYHTARWPHEPVSFAGKRVAVIGTGATGVQLISEVAKTVGHLTVFQRRPNWCAPLHNSPIDPAEQPRIKASYPEVFEKCRQSATAFIHRADRRRALEASPAEREAFFEQLYAQPGFGIWLANYRDTLVDEEANALISDFIARKIRERVQDPVVAEKLIPKDHGFGTRRVPMETRYYEVYNQDNVALVSLPDEPIEAITPAGIRTSAREYAFDMIIYATGFDAVLGGFNKLDIRGQGGLRLRDVWAEGPRTYLGLQVAGFPNLFMLLGPHNGAANCNMPRCIETNVDWVTDLLRHVRDKGYRRVESTTEAQEAWTQHVYESAEGLLSTKVDSWFMGINSNIPGRQKRMFLLYGAGAPAYRKKCEEVAARGYEGMRLA